MVIGRRALALAADKQKILDVGGACPNWLSWRAHTIVDILPAWQATLNVCGDADFPGTWDQVLAEVSAHGLYDFAVCTCTLEDISNPVYVCQMLTRVATAGYIAVPTKWHELTKWGTHRGFIHHRYIFEPYPDKIVVYPKLGYLECSRFDSIPARHPERLELEIHWQDTLNIEYVNGGFLGPSVEAVIEMYEAGMEREWDD